MIYAHFDPQDQRVQTLREHSCHVALLMESFCGDIGLPKTGKVIGLLHDAGKSKAEFQSYLLSGQKDQKGRINHSACGAQALEKLLFPAGIPIQLEKKQVAAFVFFQLASIPILGHHRGLMDIHDELGNSPYEQLLNKVDDDQTAKNYLTESLSTKEWESLISSAVSELDHFIKNLHCVSSLQRSLFMGLLERYCFSSLIDADRLDTACFFNHQELSEKQDRDPVWRQLRDRLESELEAMNIENPTGASDEMAAIRKRVSDSCLQAASGEQGIYRLNVITGGGKTLSSLRYGLHYACNHPGIRHIIYVIPYLSILMQNSKTVREVLQIGEDSDLLLEHYSDFLNHEIQTLSKEELQAYELNTERWESPIIITSLVHFMDTLYSGRKKDARRMHQLSHSVIIFDEIQSLPNTNLHLFTEAVNMLKEIAGSTILLCSATLPPLDQLDHPVLLNPIKDLDTGYIQDLKTIKRTSLINLTNQLPKNPDQIADLLMEWSAQSSNLLCVMNTVRGARTVYRLLCQQFENDPAKPELILLTTLLCPAHRKEQIRRLIQRLEQGQRIICVSTSLIEAGVDISFDTVLRACSGLDSLVQIAGRCNRHGRAPQGKVVLFYSDEINNLERYPAHSVVGQISRKINSTRKVLTLLAQDPESVKNDLMSAEALAVYYRTYYEKLGNELDYPVQACRTILDMLSTNQYIREIIAGKKPDTIHHWYLKQSFETAGRYFKVIDQSTVQVLVPYQKGIALIEELNSLSVIKDPYVKSARMKEIRRRSQDYVVNISESQIKNRKEDFVYDESGDVYWLKQGCYSMEEGIREFEAETMIV